MEIKKAASIFIISLIGGLSMPSKAQIIKTSSNNIGFPTDFTEAAEKSVNGVVHIKSTYESTTNQGVYDPFNDFFFGFGDRIQPQKRQPQEATGSGVIISEDGYIVTNNHVINNANEITVTLNDRNTYSAKVIGADPTTDLALLKIDGKNLPFVKYGNSEDVKVGEWVLAVGNPFNLTSTVTAGIVSAKGRNINILDNKFAIESFIQTDAAVNPGNSGGALVNTKGELIGINTAIQSNTGSYTGYSFAIPVNIVKKAMDDLLKYGEVQRAFLGVSIRELDSKFAQEKKVALIPGVYVEEVTEGGAANDAGINKGDIIVRIEDKSVKTVPQLQEKLNSYRPGDKISVDLIREGKEKNVTLILKSKNNDTKVIKKEVSESILFLGAELEEASSEEMSKLKIKNGMKITKLNPGKLRSAGIQQGFIITHIDHKPIKNKEDVKNALDGKKGGILVGGIYPNGSEAFYGFGI